MPVYGSRVRKNPRGLTLVSTRHSPRQFPLPPYSYAEECHPTLLFIALDLPRSGDADDDNGDVVLAAALVGESHQSISADLQVVSRKVPG